jgi:hypothetical protein
MEAHGFLYSPALTEDFRYSTSAAFYRKSQIRVSQAFEKSLPPEMWLFGYIYPCMYICMPVFEYIILYHI